MGKVYFNVSSRSIRSLWRESVSTAWWALIELLKNSYDADAKNCYIFFDIPFWWSIPEILSEEEYNFLREELWKINEDINEFYLKNSNGVIEKVLDSEKNSDIIKNIIMRLSSLYVIDDWEWMSEKIISENWMTISTNDKEINYITGNWRIKNWSKWIWRFALDRLWNKCDLISFVKDKNSSEKWIYWSVLWDDFEWEKKLLTDVHADLDSIDSNFLNEINKLNTLDKSIFSASKNWTIIKISSLRDLWDEKTLDKTFVDLEKIRPTVDWYKFKLYMWSSCKDYWLVESLSLNDYDYKVNVIYDGNKFDITINRNEFELATFPYDIFDKYKFFYDKKNLFSEGIIKNKEVSYTKSVKELSWKIDENTLKKIWKFSFEYFFLKKWKVTDPDYGNIYHQKNIIASHRKDWLDVNSWIRIYRDNFKVKPYWEHGSSSWDWLRLWERLAWNPAQASRKWWKVSPWNIAWFLNISRVANSVLNDKSNREWIIENEYYDLLKNVLVELIREFEEDRSNLYIYLKDYWKSINIDKHKSDESKKKADDLLLLKKKEEVGLSEWKEKVTENRDSWTKDDYEKKLKKVELDIDDTLVAYESLKKEKVKLTDEVSISNTLATKWLIFNTLHHEIIASKSKVSDRIESLKNFLVSILKLQKEDYILEKSLNKNPFLSLEWLEWNFSKMWNWIEFAFWTIKADKRKNKVIKISEYLEVLYSEWKFFLEKEKIEFTFSSDEVLSIKIKPMELDTIFNNLIINSIEALNSIRTSERKINIEIIWDDWSIIIKYSDTWPGLDKEIKDTSWFFESNNTTKKSEWTWIWLWILKTTVDNYDWEIFVNRDLNWFNIDIKF